LDGMELTRATGFGHQINAAITKNSGRPEFCCNNLIYNNSPLKSDQKFMHSAGNVKGS
jgi:hypothetical protein